MDLKRSVRYRGSCFSGVPQRSVIGPILYANGIFNLLMYQFKHVLFADDTDLSYSSIVVQTIEIVVNGGLSKSITDMALLY